MPDAVTQVRRRGGLDLPRGAAGRSWDHFDPLVVTPEQEVRRGRGTVLARQRHGGIVIVLFSPDALEAGKSLFNCFRQA